MKARLKASLPLPFVNESGVIQNLVEEPCGSVAIITSVAGSVRSGHYHLTDWHYLYVVQGEMRYGSRPVGSEGELEWVTAKEGEMIFTPPLVEHWTEFPVFTVLISASKLTRTHENHEADLVRLNAAHHPV